MNTDPIPICWRSEAFAEDLLDDGADGSVAGDSTGAGSILARLAGLLPLMLATVSGAFATWRSTAA